MPNLPIVYWQENKKKKAAKNVTCTKYPDIYDLHFNNQYWQETETSNGTFLLYGRTWTCALRTGWTPQCVSWA